MPLDRRQVESALEKKGFIRTEGDHSFFVYYSQAGKKSPVRTKVSHGTGSKQLGDPLVSVMAKQCKITKGQFVALVECPLTRSEYESKLVQQGFVDASGAVSSSEDAW